ncbi:MAG: thioredoxin family protein [Gammaproteobacteria bacterium]|nr:thioredoxin family protein [Gammaproteobacteria bacterium]MDH3448295.1 thioredoxin family protein [Gammaproteobacteria bacterium]
MVQTPSTMLDIGTQAPDFSLPEPASGKTVNLADYAEKPLLVVFSCNHCPYVLHIIESFAAFANEAQNRGLAVVMINANDVAGYPDDSPDRMVAMAKRLGFGFPYLYDESQQVAMSYRAACTPDFFLFDGAHRLVYRGQYDGSRPGNKIAVDGSDLKAAVEALLAGGDIGAEQIPSVGCNIKWRAGNEPDYC